MELAYILVLETRALKSVQDRHLPSAFLTALSDKISLRPPQG